MSKYPGRIVTDLAPAGYSVYFDGSGDFLTLPSTSALAMGTGDFCVEMWIYPTAPSGDQCIYANFASGGGNTQMGFFIRNGNSIRFSSWDTAFLDSAAGTIVANTWYHLVVCRSGNNGALFINGVRQASQSGSPNDFSSTNAINIGRRPANDQFFPGYVSNVRAVKGSSVYDPTQTTLRVPTQLFPITNTQLLTCQSPSFVDNSTNNFAITVNGNAATSTFTPFPAYVPYNPALGASTPGVWTVDEAMQAAATRQWNMYDPYFNLTTLLLHGNQPADVTDTNNNTFKDSSSNNFGITRNGNTTQGTFSPFSQTGWGNYFISPNYLRIAYNAAFLWSTGARTFEAWVYLNSTSSNNVIFGLDNESSSNTWELFVNTSGQVVFRYYNGASQTVTTTSTVLTNAWTHIAFTYDGTSVITLYINGVSAGTGTKQGTPITDNNPLLIAHTLVGLAGNAYFNGYISNVRFTSAVVYTGNFTPSTTPLTAITNTSLLTCQSNRFVDNSTNTFAITVINTPSVQPFSPFLPTVAYTPQTIGGSGYFDGSGDSLSVATNAALTVTGNVDACFEAWIYPTETPGATATILQKSGISGSVFSNYELGFSSSRLLVLFGGNSGSPGSSVFTLNGATTLPLNAWSHVVGTKRYVGGGSTNEYRVFVNGKLDGFTTAANISDGNAQAFTVGALPSGTAFTGYISGNRVFNTSIPASYQTTSTTVGTQIFTSPTAPATAGTASILCNFTNAGVVDSTADNVFETAGNAQISTTQSKFGGSSMYFDGTGDYLKGVYSPNMILSGDFTIECWINFSAHGNYGGIISFATPNTSVAPTSGWALVFYQTTDRLYFEAGGGVGITATNAVTANQWNHIAVVRSGSTITHYLNGTANGTGTSSATFTPLTTDNFAIGSNRGFDSSMTGYLDDIRITRGYARYTGNFTPQTSQWQDQ